MPRDDQVRRQWRIWRLLAAAQRALTVEEILDRLDPTDQASARTIRRDLEVLEAVGAPLSVTHESRTVRYAIADDGPPLRLDADGLLALHLAVGLLRPFATTPLGEQLAQLVTRLQRHLPERLLAHFAPLAEEVQVRWPALPSYEDAAAAIEAIRGALVEGETTRIDYEDAEGARSTREVHPQGLVYGLRGLYLIGSDDSRDGALRTFRVDRIRCAEPTGRRARQLPDFDAEEYLAGSLGVHSPEHEPRRIGVRIYGALTARLLAESPWHASQRLERRGEHWELTLVLRSFREVFPRLLALGAKAEVVEPVELRDEIAAELRRALERYPASPLDLGSRSQSDRGVS